MSSVRLLKDHPKGKKDQIVSVPFGVGREMFLAGEAVYPAPSETPPAARGAVVASPPGDRHAQEIARLNALHASTVQAIKDDAAAGAKAKDRQHAEEIAKLQLDLEQARHQVTELQASAKKK